MSRKLHGMLVALVAVSSLAISVPQLLAQGYLSLDSSEGSSVRLATATSDQQLFDAPEKTYIRRTALFTTDPAKRARRTREYTSVVRQARRPAEKQQMAEPGGAFTIASDSGLEEGSANKASEPEFLPHPMPIEDIDIGVYDDGVYDGGVYDDGDCRCGRVCCSNHYSIFTEFLYLRPGNVDYVYAIEQTGPDPNTDSQTGPVGQAAIGHSGGGRIGLIRPLGDCSSIVATYSYFESADDDSIAATGSNVLASERTEGSVANSASTSLSAISRYEIDFQTVDVDFRRVFRQTCDTSLSYSVGLRYVNLDQQSMSQQIVQSADGLTTVVTDTRFDGLGIGFRLDGERRSQCNGFLAYAKSGASFLAGEFHSEFRQTNQLNTALIANDLSDYRIMPVLETEIGIGWQNQCGSIRFTTGYLVSAWFNTLTVPEYVEGVQTKNYESLGETLTFSGITTRLEYLY